MVIRLFDHPTVTCPECQGRGEIQLDHTARRDPSTGTWEVDTPVCTACAGHGVVPETLAQHSRCCNVTVWRDRGLCPEHDDLCDEHRPAGPCSACADDHDWDADSYYEGRAS